MASPPGPRVQKLEHRRRWAVMYCIVLAAAVVFFLALRYWFGVVVFGLCLAALATEATRTNRELRRIGLGLVPSEDEPRPPWAM